MKRVYVAGKYSADNVIDVLENIKQGINHGALVLKMGCAVFCPHLDHHFAMSAWGSILSKKQYQDNSMAWLEVSDIVYIMPDSKDSRGVQREIERAKELHIPICYSLNELREAIA
jgi:Domain of unknown function (DUF4406)